jgi:hypothetical protein
MVTIKQYTERKTKGVCTACGAHPPVEGTLACEKCTKSAKEYYERHKAERLAAAAKYREKHLQRYKELQKKYKISRVASGTCIVCGKRPAVEGIQRCEPCRIKQNEIGAANNLKRKEEIWAHYFNGESKCQPHKELQGIDSPDFDLRILEMHHLNGDGATHKRKLFLQNGVSTPYYSNLIKLGFPPLDIISVCPTCHRILELQKHTVNPK